jgi:hypothetical protein
MKPARVNGFRLSSGRHEDVMELTCSLDWGLVESLPSTLMQGEFGVVLVPIEAPSRFSMFRATSLARAGRTAYRPRFR